MVTLRLESWFALFRYLKPLQFTVQVLILTIDTKFDILCLKLQNNSQLFTVIVIKW